MPLIDTGRFMGPAVRSGLSVLKRKIEELSKHKIPEDLQSLPQIDYREALQAGNWPAAVEAWHEIGEPPQLGAAGGILAGHSIMKPKTGRSLVPYQGTRAVSEANRRFRQEESQFARQRKLDRQNERRLAAARPEGPGGLPALQEASDEADAAFAERLDQVESDELGGDGRKFTDFFSKVTRGEAGVGDIGKEYEPVLDTTQIAPFAEVLSEHTGGNFDKHIATSIPGYPEVQAIVGNAIVASLPDGGSFLDIAASEGGLAKAVTDYSGGHILSTIVDPNPDMHRSFQRISTVHGVDYRVEAFSSAEDAGKAAWIEPDGTTIYNFTPDKKYDVIHESMGFQFISNTRKAQVARMKEMLAKDGLVILQEKFVPTSDDIEAWEAREAKKDEFKLQYFSKGELDEKKEQTLTGMHQLMVTSPRMEKILTGQFKYVAQYWDSGNFKGYVASDSRERLYKFLGSLPDTMSEFSGVVTPRIVAAGARRTPRLNAAEKEAIKLGGRVAENAARLLKAKFSEDDGWARMDVTGLGAKEGGPAKIKVKGIGYGFHKGDAPEEERIEMLATKVVEEIETVIRAAAAGDASAQKILEETDWYNEFRLRGHVELGGMVDLMGDVLGGASPQASPPQNWDHAVEAIGRFARGHYDNILAEYRAYREAGGTIGKYKGPVIERRDASAFGVNGRNMMEGLLGVWRQLEKGSRPKAKNFSGNLVGHSNRATIDAWQARQLQRFAGLPRIPPPAERAVYGSYGKGTGGDVSRVGGAYGFAEKVYARAGELLGLAPHEVQPLAWYIERQLWMDNGWERRPSVSFEELANKRPFGRHMAGLSAQQGGKVPSAREQTRVAEAVTGVLSGDRGVVAYKANTTQGLFAGDPPEKSLDIEVTADAGWDPVKFIGSVASEAARVGQEAATVSRVLDPRGEISDNMRPGVEVFFFQPKTVKEMREFEAQLDGLAEFGFTYITDLRHGQRAGGAMPKEFRGVRLQYVPEFEAARSAEFRARFKADPGYLDEVLAERKSQLVDLAERAGNIEGVRLSQLLDYETLVMRDGEYDAYTGRSAGIRGQQVRMGQPLRDHVAAAVRHAEERRQVENRDLSVGGVPEEGGGAEVVYHVTPTRNVERIKVEGLKQLQTSNWGLASGERANPQGGLFVFENPHDAARHAARSEYDMKEPQSIVAVRRGETPFEADPTQDHRFTTGKGASLQTMHPVPPGDIATVVDFSSMPKAGPQGIDFDAFLDQMVGKLIRR